MGLSFPPSRVDRGTGVGEKKGTATLKEQWLPVGKNTATPRAMADARWDRKKHELRVPIKDLEL